MNRQFMFQQMRFVLGIGGFMSFYGVASLIIFVGGRYLNVSLSMKLVVFFMLLLTVPFVLVGGYFVNRKKKKKEAAEAETEKDEPGEGTDSAKPAAPSGNYSDLNSSTAEVVDFLKDSNLGTGAGGKESVYSLPWYLVAGGPGSGKTSLVLTSGLNFQSLPSQRQSELNLVKPTKQVDWRVTSDAVFIDTAGRFQSETDNDEWASLIEAVKKHRGKRPLDGLLLTVNTELLLAADDRDLEEQAKLMRARLDDATKRLKTRFPVYLIFTHADAIEGFRDSFSASKNEGENLVWGTTIPLSKSDNGQAMFDSEYEILQESIMKRRLIRLSAPFSPVRQLRIFNFPLHFGSARRKLGAFVSTLFRPNPFSESPFLRGFYFTASPADKTRGRGKPGQIPKTVGSSFFTKRLINDVVLRDKDLVRTFHESKQRKPISGWILTLLGTFGVLIFLGLSGLSLYNNKRLMDDAVASANEVVAIRRADEDKDLAKKSPEEAQREIDALEDLRLHLKRLDDFDRDGPDFQYRFGFYSGSRILREGLLNIYYNAVERRFRQPTLAKLKSELAAFSKTKGIATGALTPDQEKTLERNYELLEAYLMLTNEYKERAEATTISETLSDIWVSESKLPAGNETKAKAQLDFYFKQVDRESEYPGDTSGFQRLTEDKDLVKAVRANLVAFPPYLRYLKGKVGEATKEVEPATVASLLEGRGQGVLEGTHQIPGAYTMLGYRDHMKLSLEEAGGKMNEDNWVMGRKGDETQATEDELKKLRDKYFNDYTDHWRKMVREIRTREYKTSEDISQALTAFSDAESPMKLLLTEIAANTDFSVKTEDEGWFDLSWITDKIFGGDEPKEGPTKNIVENEFKPLFDFVGRGQEEDAKGNGITNYGKQIGLLNKELGDVSDAKKAEITQELVNEKGKNYSLIDNAEKNVTELTRTLNTQAGKEVAALLAQPVNAVRDYFGAGAKDQLQRDWAQTILAKAREVESGYPFSGDGEADLNKLSAYLNPESGEFSKFYKARLERYFEEVNGQYKVKETSGMTFTPEFVAYINSAMNLRKALFGANPAPNFEYDIRLLPVDGTLVELSIDGQTVTSDQTGSTKMKFPAATGTSTGVLMRISSTSSPTLPGSSTANPSNSSVNSSSTTVPSNFQEDKGSGEIRHQGTWGLFRFFDAGSPEKQASGEYLLSYSLDGKTVKATIKPTGGDLFDKSLFTGLKAPDKMVQ